MKIPGVPAKKSGTKLKRGRALQIMCYPRQKTKAVLVEASRKANVSLSSFLVLAALVQAAAVLGRKISRLVPRDELRHYRTPRVNPMRTAAAKRAWLTIRAKQNVTQLDKVDEQQPVVSLEGVAGGCAQSRQWDESSEPLSPRASDIVRVADTSGHT